jgi:hypothetical protein
MMPHLWHSRLPCYEIRNLTGFEDNYSAFIKDCYWKDLPIPCAAVFDLVPTDEGMCCAFNRAKADTILLDSPYSRMITR